MEVISKQEKSKSHQEFKKLLSEDLGNRKFKEGEIAIGTISEIGKKFVFVDLGLKSEGAIPIEEFKLTKELDKIKVGVKIEVLLEKISELSSAGLNKLMILPGLEPRYEVLKRVAKDLLANLNS